jgi:hypothetical protein
MRSLSLEAGMYIFSLLLPTSLIFSAFLCSPEQQRRDAAYENLMLPANILATLKIRQWASKAEAMQVVQSWLGVTTLSFHIKLPQSLHSLCDRLQNLDLHFDTAEML